MTRLSLLLGVLLLSQCVLLVDVLQQLSIEAGFTYEISDYAKQANETWDGVFSRSLNNFDLIGSWWFSKHSRSLLGDFLPPYVDSQYVLISRKPKQLKRTYRLDNFLTPFTPGTWGVLIATVILTGMVIFMFDRGIDLMFEKARHEPESPSYRRKSLKKMKSFWRRKGEEIEQGLEHGIAEAVDALAGGSVMTTQIQNGAAQLVSWSFTFFIVVVKSDNTTNP